MKKIYSTVEPGKLLHMIVYYEDLRESEAQRIDICDPDQFLQCAGLNIPKGKKYRPHEHIWKDGPSKIIAQESWCVMRGRVKVFLYDLDGKCIATEELVAGDASFTFFGGHTYEVMEDAVVYEYKTGPYKDQSSDKKFIGE